MTMSAATACLLLLIASPDPFRRQARTKISPPRFLRSHALWLRSATEAHAHDADCAPPPPEFRAFERLMSLSGCDTPFGKLSLRQNRFGYRGVHADFTVEEGEPGVGEGDILLSVPLSSCVREARDVDDSVKEDDDYRTLCLAKSFISMERLDDSDYDCLLFDAWSDLLPHPDELRETLPVHWSNAVLESTGLQSFRDKVESYRRVRSKLKPYLIPDDDGGTTAERPLKRQGRTPDDVLDLINTRAVRTEIEGSFRGNILAPVFDMINHAGHGWNNADYGLELVEGVDNQVGVTREEGDDRSYRLVVRAKRGLDPGEEILIDYGEGTRDLQCLHNYGFLPDASRGGELEGDAEIMDEEGGIHILTRGFMYGLNTELLLAVSEAVTGGVSKDVKDENLLSKGLGEAEVVWIVARIDDATQRLVDAFKLETCNRDVQGGSTDTSILLATEVGKAAGRLLDKCRKRLVTDNIRSPFRRVGLMLQKMRRRSW